MALLSLERPRGVKKVSWLTLLGIVLVPLAIGGLLVWALWNPTDRLDQITAAVVNEDTPVEINGQTVPLGRQLAAGLVTGGTESTATPSPTPVPISSSLPPPTSRSGNVSQAKRWSAKMYDNAHPAANAITARTSRPRNSRRCSSSGMRTSSVAMGGLAGTSSVAAGGLASSRLATGSRAGYGLSAGGTERSRGLGCFGLRVRRGRGGV